MESVMNKVWQNLFILFFLTFGIQISAYFFNSFSYGFVFLGILVSLIYPLRLSSSLLKIILYGWIFLLLQTYLTSNIGYKPFFSSIALIFCSILYLQLGYQVRIQSSRDKKILAYSFLSIFLFSVLACVITRFSKYYIGWDLTKSSFPFQEPSHLALFSGPIFVFLISHANQQKVMLFLVVFAASILCENLTMLLFAFFSFFLIDWSILKSTSLLNIICIIAIIFFLGDIVNNGYFFHRIYALIDQKTDNVSVLVYLQGWESIINTIKYHPMGIGFQQLGYEQPGEYAKYIYQLWGHYANRQDGGFFFAKFFTEFGLLAFPISLVFFLKINKVFQIAMKTNPIAAKSVLNMYLSLCVPLFFRDTGYFSYSFFYFFLATGYLCRVANLKITFLHRASSLIKI